MQTAYPFDPPVALKGMPVDMLHEPCESFSCEGVSTWGHGVVRGTAENQVKRPTAAGQAFRGIATRDESAGPQTLPANRDGYLDKETVSVGRKGKWWVETDGAVTDGAPAFLVMTGADAGKFSVTDTASSDPVPSGIFRGATTGAGIAQLEINLPA